MITCYTGEILCSAPHDKRGKKEGKLLLLCLRKSVNWLVTYIEPLGTLNSEGTCKGVRNGGDSFTETGLCAQVSEAMHHNRKAAGILMRLIISTKGEKICFLLFLQRCLNSCPFFKSCVLSPASHHLVSP